MQTSAEEIIFLPDFRDIANFMKDLRIRISIRIQRSHRKQFKAKEEVKVTERGAKMGFAEIEQ